MAFNLQLPGSDMMCHLNWNGEQFLKKRKNQVRGSNLNNCSMYDYKQKIGYSTPSLCFQTDVIYPNALAAVTRVSCEEDRFVMGCRGNEINKDFVLEARLPIAVPLVQYPSNTAGPSWNELDTCAQPVINWENYIRDLRCEFSHNSLIWTHRKNSRYPDFHSDPTKSVGNERNDQQDPDLLEDNQELLGHESPDFNEELISEPQPSTSKCSASQTKQMKGKKISRADLAREIFRNPVDLELNFKGRTLLEEKNNLDLLSLGKKHETKPSLDLSKVKVLGGKRKATTKHKLLIATLKKLKSQPEERVEASWNYMYGGLTGTCCYINGPVGVDTTKTVYVSNQTRLRKLTLEKTKRSSMLSYKLKYVWEEDPPKETSYMNDNIFQIVASNRANIIGTRRDKVINIYSIENDDPYLLDCIPNILYGTNVYDGMRKKNHVGVNKDPLLLGLDFNPQYWPELITIDENLQIRVCDISKGKTVNTYGLAKSVSAKTKLKNYPKFRKINDASGISFSTYGQVFFAWNDSKVVLGDRRDCNHSRANLMDLFDLRRSTSSLSWSDQTFFNGTKPELNDYISSLKKSGKEYYYYVGTTARILMMDLRVPGQPVLKMDHGMRSAATYLDTYTNDDFEIIVAASQRLPSTFCAITDYSHVNCAERPNCEAKNPVLNCLPRQLSSSMEFFDSAFAEGYGLSWESDHRRAMNHNYAWTTGLSVCKGPTNNDGHKPPGILVFTTNCFGDVFYQEWEQGPIENFKKTSLTDHELTQFFEKWRTSMKSKAMTEFQKPTLNPKMSVDCSLLLEPCGRNVRRMSSVRDKPFDPFKPNEIHNQYVEESQITIEDRRKKLRKSRSAFVKKFLDVWESDPDVDDVDEVGVKREEAELNDRYTSHQNEDGTNDVELVNFGPQEMQELVELEEQINKEIRNDPLPDIIEQDEENQSEEESDHLESDIEELLSIDSKAEASDSDVKINKDQRRLPTPATIKQVDKDLREEESEYSSSDREELLSPDSKNEASDTDLSENNDVQSNLMHQGSVLKPRGTFSSATMQKETGYVKPPKSKENTLVDNSDHDMSQSWKSEDYLEVESTSRNETDEFGNFISNRNRPSTSRSPELCPQLYSQTPETLQYDDNEEEPYDLYENQKLSQPSEDEEFGDVIPASQPKTKYNLARKSGF